jgi:hypothetical protein
LRPLFFINKFIKELTEDMSRITGNEVQGLMEAYNEVYASQELTEEQVWEEVENWVNSLVEEGYDLSEYTWEDMYEAYLGEMGQPGGNRPGGNRPITNAPYRSRFARPMNAGTVSQGTRRGAAPSRVTRPQIGSLPPSARQVTQYPAGVSTGVSGGNAGASPAPAPKPAARPAPATTAPARPAAPPAAASPASAKPKPSTPSAPPPPTSGPSAPPPPTAKRPSLASQAEDLRRMAEKSQQRQAAMLKQSFDLYDIIKGHLIDEGYADTEEAAEAIMVSMSEEWRESILEQMAPPPVSAPPHPVDLPPPVSAPPTPPKTKKKNNEGKGEPMHPKGKEYPSAEKSIPGWNN